MQHEHRGFVAPETPTEKIIAQIWRDMLGSDSVSSSDTFLSLGGQSILAVQCLNRIQAECGVDIAPALLFEDDITVAVLAKIVDQAALSSDIVPPKCLSGNSS
jgi:hypothetical protein